MTRKNPAIAVLLLLFSLFSAAAGAEEPALATPTDLECTHEQTKTIIYFFDSPVYIPLGPDSHRVSGPATVEVTCVACGEVLSSEDVSNAEEIRSHRMKNGACALCGYKDRGDRSGKATETPASVPGERIMIATESTDTVSLNVTEILKQTEPLDADLYLELAEREDGSLFTGIFLVDEAGNRSQPDSEGIALRFYRQSKADVRISLAPAREDSLIEIEGEWNENGYWSVPYLQEGTYFLLQ